MTTVQMQILQKPSDLDLHCLQRQGSSGFSRTKVNIQVLKRYLSLELLFQSTKYLNHQVPSKIAAGDIRIYSFFFFCFFSEKISCIISCDFFVCLNLTFFEK